LADETEITPEAPRRPSLEFDVSHRCAAWRPGQPSVSVPSALSTVHPDPVRSPEHPHGANAATESPDPPAV